MKLFFKLFILIISFKGNTQTLFNITYNNNRTEAKKVQHVLHHYFHIRRSAIGLQHRKKPCQKKRSDFIQICIQKDKKFRIFDRSGNSFKSIKPLVNESMN